MEVIAGDRDRMTEAIEHFPGVVEVQLFGERAHVRLQPESPLSDPDRFRAALRTAGIEPESVRRVPTSLEDVFIAQVMHHG